MTWLDTLTAGRDLNAAEGRSFLEALIDPGVSLDVKVQALGALREKGETPEEIRAMALAMRDAAVAVALPPGEVYVDTCGTGGDGSDSFNISTTAALLAAAAGVRVVKHGNRSVSSRCGSADLIEALGLPLSSDGETAAKQLRECGFTFLFAPSFHPSTAAAGPARRALGGRSVFNLLGPLTNPAAPPFQVTGAYSEAAAEKMAHALSGMPIQRCFVVHGTPGWDEATPCGPFVRFDVTPGQVVREVIDPLETYGMVRCQPEDLAGGDADDNLQTVRDVFSGMPGPRLDAVLLNAALVLELVGQAPGPKEALALATEAVHDGRATWFLEALEGGCHGLS